MGTEDDKNYNDAGSRAIAAMWGAMYEELRRRGATHKSARAIVIAYLRLTLIGTNTS